MSRAKTESPGVRNKNSIFGRLVSTFLLLVGTPVFAINGLKGDYYPNITLAGAPVLTRVDSNVDYNWGSGSPHTSVPSNMFSARWMGSVLAPYSETYTFYVKGDNGIRLWVNGQQLINNWSLLASGEKSGTITLEGGKRYNVALEYFELSGNAEIRLQWASASLSKQPIASSNLFTSSANGLSADYFNNKELSGEPALSRTDQTVDFGWGSASPAIGVVNADNFSVLWRGSVTPQHSETYTFYTQSDDGVRLWVDGNLVVDNWTLHSSTENQGSVTLEAGRSYNVQMEFFENTGSAESRLRWSSPSQAKQIIPMERLTPYATWDNQDIGTITNAGALTYHTEDNLVELTGSGTVTSAEDRYHVVYQPLHGDGEITARLVSQSPVGGSSLPSSAAAGLVLRDSTNSTGLSMGLFARTNLSVLIHERKTAGGSGSTRAGASSIPATPIWLKLVRKGGMVSSYTSTDGDNWTLQAHSIVNLPARVIVGLAIYTNSSNTALKNLAVFDNISVIQGLPPSPDVDTDGDGATDIQEAIMGTDILLTHSPNNASGGVASDGEVWQSLTSISTSVVTPNAYEKENTSARIRISRSKGTMPLTLNLTKSGNTDSTKGSASAADYILKDGNGAAINGSTITIPSGATTYDIVIEPVADTLSEVPEMLRLNVRTNSLGGAKQYGSTQPVHIRDATNIETNRRLFVAYYSRGGSAQTTATGVSTLLLNGDNTSAVINVSFSNLSSEQSSSHLHAAPAGQPQGTGPIIESVPLGQVTDRVWSIAAETNGGWMTDQATLDGLLNGYLYTNIGTSNYPGGEIRGNYTLASGSVIPPPTPADPPVYGSSEWPTLTGADLDRDIVRFLMQATFGPTPESIQEIKDLIAANGNDPLAGYAAWIDKQMNSSLTPSPSLVRLVQAADVEDFVLRGNRHINATSDPQFGGASFSWSSSTRSWNPSTIHSNNYPNYTNRRREWWTLILQSKDQLRQRMAWALSQIVVVSDMNSTVATYHYGLASYWDMLAGGAFGKYRDLLEGVTLHPIMGMYLSHLKNRKASGNITPDENYAREIMQLFSIGLVQRHPDGSLVLNAQGLPVPTYDQEDIRELARVMTGLSFGVRHASVANAPTYPNPSSQSIGDVIENTSFTLGNGVRYWQAQWMNPMKMFDTYHDFGAKTLFNGKVGHTVIPARTNNSGTESEGLTDIHDALNVLAGSPGASSYDGHPNTPVFISRLLIQRFTTSNPSSGYLYRVANTYRQSNGNLGEVIKAILLDYEARSLHYVDNVASAGKAKEPLLHYTAYLRASKAYTGAPLANLNAMSVPFSSMESPITEPYPTSELSKFPPGALRFRFFDSTTQLSQSPLRAPTVFNWFLPDYVASGPLSAAGLVAPELMVATESNVVNIVNNQYSTIFASLPSTTNANTGRGLDDFPNIAQYQNASGVQLSIPQYGVDAGYFSASTFDASPEGTESASTISKQKDNMQVTWDELIAEYIAAYEQSLVQQYSPNPVPTSPATAQRKEAHAAAVIALVDRQDLLFTGGYLKAKFGSDSGDNPRQIIINAVNLIAANNRHTSDATNFSNDARTRIRNINYLILSSPQAVVLK